NMNFLPGGRGVAESFFFPATFPPEEEDFFFLIPSILFPPRITGKNTPLKLYSYLRSGVPIVATKIVSHTQVLTDDVALLVEPQPQSLSSGVLRLLEDAQLCNQLVENASRLARTSSPPYPYHPNFA